MWTESVDIVDRKAHDTYMTTATTAKYTSPTQIDFYANHDSDAPAWGQLALRGEA